MLSKCCDIVLWVYALKASCVSFTVTYHFSKVTGRDELLEAIHMLLFKRKGKVCYMLADVNQDISWQCSLHTDMPPRQDTCFHEAEDMFNCLKHPVPIPRKCVAARYEEA